MRRRFTILLAALLLTCGLSWAQTTITWTASEQGYTNGQEITSVDFDNNVSATFNKGTNSNSPKYYTTGEAIRCYGGNYFTVTSENTLTEITISFSSGEGTNEITSDCGTYQNGSWTGEANSVTFTIGGTSGHRRIASFDITYSSEAPAVAAPTFSPASGTEFGNEGLSVTINCETPGVDIYYTLDGSNPDDESNPYNGPISLTETTTIKAVAYDGNENTSAVATATYTYVDPNVPGTENNPYTVAQARAAIDAGTGTQGVYATGIVSAIPTAYSTQYSNITFNMVDEEGDEDFLQAYRCGGDEAANVAVGDIVVVYGNLTKYNTTYEFGQGCTLVSLTHPTGFVEAPTFNPAAGTYDEAQTVTISCADANATIYYTLDGTEPTDASTQYTTAINVTTTTTIKAIAYVGTNASAVTTAIYNIVSLANISDITEVGTAYEVQGTVVATNSRGFVMGDGTGYIYYYKNGAVSQSIGDMVKISGTTGTYGQIIQFTNTATVTEATTSNYNGTPAATLITEVPDYSEGYHLSTYFEFEGELTKTSGNYLIALGDAQIQISYPTTEQGNALTALTDKNVHVKGYFAGINSNDKFTVMLESVEEVVSTEPFITVTPATVNFAAIGTEGFQMVNLTITYENIEVADYQSFTIQFYDNEGNETTTPTDWPVVGVTGTNDEGYLVHCVANDNTGEARTAYFKVYAYDLENNKVYSDLVTINQEAYVAPTIAVLPFIWEGGSSADFEALDGVTISGNGTDYNFDNHSPYLIKLDDTGDYIEVHTDSQPGIVTIGVKMIGGGNTSTITVQGSTDGETFDEGEALTISGAQNNIVNLVSTRTFGEDVRYVRLYFTKGSNVGVGPITIAKPVTDPVITVNPATVDAAAEGGNGTLTVTYQNITDITANVFFCDAEGAAATYNWITAEVNDDDNVAYTINANDGEARTAYLKVNVGETYSNLVTINQAAYVVPPTPGEWVLTNLADLTENDVFVIVGDNGNTYAMSNDNGTTAAPAAVAVTVVDNTLSGEIAANLQWNIGITDGCYIFYPNGETETWLYCTNTNNGVRVGTNEANVFTTSVEGYLVNTSNGRYIGIYNSQDWRCYTSINSNIEGQSFAFYKKVTSSQTTTQTVNLATGTNWFSSNVEITLEDLQNALTDVLGTNASITISSQTQSCTIKRNKWTGTLETIDLSQMYMIEVETACEISLEGEPINPANHPVTISFGENWIAFPLNVTMSLNDAFAGFAQNDDAISSQTANASVKRNKWTGTMSDLQPGQGYIYTSAVSGSRTHIFPTIR